MDLGDELARFRYRPSALALALPGGFFALCGLVLTARAFATGGGQAWAAGLGAWGFVVVTVVVALRHAMKPRWVVVLRHGLEVPRGVWVDGTRAVPFGAVTWVREREIAGQVMLDIGVVGGRVTIARSHLPGRAVFEAVANVAAGGRWDPRMSSGADPEVGSDLDASSGASDSLLDPGYDTQLDSGLSRDDTPPPMRAIRHRRAQRPPSWLRPAVHILGVLSACGGPLWLTDRLTPALGQLPAFGVAVAPVLVLAFATLMIAEEARNHHTKTWAATGAIALGLVGLETVVALLALAAGHASEPVLLVLGAVVTAIVAVLYRRLAYPR